MARKPKLANFTFQKVDTLFNESVIMVLRNKDKKHIASIGDSHRYEMITEGFNPDDNQSILDYLAQWHYLDEIP